MPNPSHSRAQNVWSWTIEELILVLLRQFKRLLSEQGIELTDTDMKALAGGAASRTHGSSEASITTALHAIIAESEAVLSQMGLTFPTSILTDMDEISGWETTADFISLAGEKINAELRISAGSALMTLLGDMTVVRHAFTSASHGIDDPEDVDAVIAIRSLSFAAHLDARAKNVLTMLRSWIETVSPESKSS